MLKVDFVLVWERRSGYIRASRNIRASGGDVERCLTDAKQHIDDDRCLDIGTVAVDSPPGYSLQQHDVESPALPTYFQGVY